MATKPSTCHRPSFQDLTGKTFSRWTVLKYAGPDKSRMSLWLCRCSCGTELPVRSVSLRQGISRSCGCLKAEVASTFHRKHGKTGTPEYKAWTHMIERCENPNTKKYHNHGGRGIKVCKQWRESFVAFLEDMGPRPSSKHSLDRFPGMNGDYQPGNCRWATSQEQCRNMRKNVRLTLKDATKTLPEWADLLGIDKGTIKSRLRAGWSVEQALTTPLLHPGYRLN